MRTLSRIIVLAGVAAVAAGPGPAWGAGLRVLGAQSITSERAAAVLRANGFPDPRAIRALQESYFESGRLFVTVSVRVEADSSRTVLIEEGEVACVRRVRIAGMSTRPEGEIRRDLHLESGVPFVPRELSSRIADLLADYDGAGLPFAQVWVDSVGIDEDSAAVDVALTVVEGTQRTVSSVVVEGLKKTKKPLAVKIAGIEPGTDYRAQVLEDAFLRLTASGVFTQVDYPTVRVSADGRGVDAVLHVDEPERAHSFAGALGYASAEAGGERTLSGLVQLDLNNIGGTLKDLGVLWTNDGAGRNETHIRYRDRLFLGRRLEAGLRLEQVGQDTLYTWQSAGVDMGRNIGRAMGTLLGARVGASGDRNVYSTGTLVRSTRWRARLGASALRGSERRGGYGNLEAAVTFATKSNTYREGFTGPADVRQTIYDGALVAIVPVWRSLTYALDGRVDWLQSSEASVPLPEQFYVGGARTVRGYRENQFHGRHVAYARNELRIGRTPREGLYVFADAGSVQQETPTADGGVTLDRLGLAGWGFGVRSVSRVGRIDLSFAVSDGVSLQQTKIHVLLEQKF
jgi:outer membrane protein assembly factor BamA